MINFEEKDLKTLEKLSKIKCTEKEKSKLTEDIHKILNYFEKLKEVNTKDTLPCNFVLNTLQKNVFRKDETEETLDTDLFLSNAPDKIANMIKVPSILTEDKFS